MNQKKNLRLTAENYTPEFLEQVVMQTQGLLGVYEIKEFERLSQLDVEDFTFIWKPFRMDRNTGRVKLHPNSEKGAKMLERARAEKVMERNPWLKRFHAIGFVRMVKREPQITKNPRVQDFLLRHYNNEELTSRLDHFDAFVEYVEQFLRDDFNLDQLDAIFRMLPKVAEVMARDPRNARSRQKSEASEGEQTEANAQQEEDQSNEPNEQATDCETEAEVETRSES